MSLPEKKKKRRGTRGGRGKKQKQFNLQEETNSKRIDARYKLLDVLNKKSGSHTHQSHLDTGCSDLEKGFELVTEGPVYIARGTVVHGDFCSPLCICKGWTRESFEYKYRDQYRLKDYVISCPTCKSSEEFNFHSWIPKLQTAGACMPLWPKMQWFCSLACEKKDSDHWGYDYHRRHFCPSIYQTLEVASKSCDLGKFCCKRHKIDIHDLINLVLLKNPKVIPEVALLLVDSEIFELKWFVKEAQEVIKELFEKKTWNDIRSSVLVEDLWSEIDSFLE